MHKCVEQLGCSGGNIIPYSRDKELGFDLCNDCGIIWRSIDSIHISKIYEQVYFDSKKYNNKRKHKVKKSGWMIDQARIHNSGISDILEVGCSLGYTLEAAKNRRINHLGIDISDYAIDFCNDIGLNAKKYSFDELKQTRQKYDLIFMQHVLEHFEDPFLVLKDCFDLLQEKGIVLILVPNTKYKRAVKLNAKHRFYSLKGVGAEHYSYFNYENLRLVLQASGFEVIQENYPIFTKDFHSIEFFANRLFRRLLSVFNYDQEILIIARKIQY
ncbi:MAG: class I SAM-dependent methyltransferase [Bacteroidetes bacterium]|nr:class I SAM-dependent methyltransferase [Bacteroidota bacterium]